MAMENVPSPHSGNPYPEKSEAEQVQELYNSALQKAQEASRIWAEAYKSGTLWQCEDDSRLGEIFMIREEPVSEGGSGKTAVQKFFEREEKSLHGNKNFQEQPYWYMFHFEETMDRILKALQGITP